MEEAGMTKIKDVEYTAETRSVPLQSAKTICLVSSGIFIAILIGVSVRLFHRGNWGKAALDTVYAVALFVLIFGSTEIAIRTCQFFAELTELRAKYNGDVERIFKTVNLNFASWLCIVMSFALFSIVHNCGDNAVDRVWRFGAVRCFPSLLVAIYLCRMMGLRDSTLNSISTIHSMGGVDYGTGMAYSYYYGYLQLVLPSDGAQNPGLRHKMEQYETLQKVSIPVKKLFILIPESGHIPPDLKEASDYWLEGTTSLESEVRDRAGVKRRVYKNTVYKIHPGGDGKSNYSVYVTTEGATPMLTLWEILKHSHPQTATYREHRREIIASFYETLQTLLKNDPRCSDACELVYYNDYDENGKKVNVGEILLRRILSQVPSSK